MNDFNGKGEPLEDKRLTLSGTTPAGYQQYRLWHDSQQILVPRGQSTTRIGQSENVQCNTGVFSDISQGYFRKPVVEFRETVDYKLFDRYHLQNWRTDIPIDNPDIDYNDDLQLQSILVKYNIIVDYNGILGKSEGATWFTLIDGKNWISDVLHFDNFNVDYLRGDFFFVTNPTPQQMSTGSTMTTTTELQKVNLPISAIFKNAVLNIGNSQMKLLTKNLPFDFNIVTTNITIVGGE